MLLERKRLAIELDAVTGLFREIQSPYQIKNVLGQGLFAAAYLAHAKGTDLNVVIRVLRPEFVSQPHLRTGFLDLSQKALQVVHENLVLTREARAFPDRQIYFAVRDYVHGVTLQKALEEGKRFKPEQIARLLRGLAGALGAVHRRGLCHGGVKPSNIFLNEEGDVVLGDLSLPLSGIGVALERLSYDYRYAAPELFQGAGMPGRSSDFYALGCVAYEAACGAPPFVSSNYVVLAARHVHETIAPPYERGSPLGSVGDAIVMKLLARAPTDRYLQSDEIVRELDAFEASCRARALPGLSAETPLMRDASIKRYQGTESVMSFDPSRSEVVADTLVGARAETHLLPAMKMPAEFGNYEIIRELGRGAMGAVYGARDRRLDRFVALKIRRAFEGDPRADEEQGIRFDSEARAAARLDHPNIIKVYEVGEHFGVPYISLEYVAGKNLQQKMEGRVTPREAVELLIKLAQGVQHAHSQGVVHRDLKPSNVLLTPEGEPKIADFGLAMLDALTETWVGEMRGDQFHTVAGMVLGTPAYMSPEQFTGDRDKIGPATDIYSLGVILYTMLAGRLPLIGNDYAETLAMVTTTPVPSLRTFNPNVERDLEAICLKCLEKDPAKRYRSSSDLAADLERWLRGEAVLARPSRVKWWLSLLSFGKRNRGESR